MYYRKLLLLLLALFSLLMTERSAFACPLINGLVDYNCDRTLKLSFTGDSIVYGVGDERHNDAGGYVARLANRFPSSMVRNIGVRGITTQRLIRAFKKNLNKQPPGKTFERSVHTDVIIIDVGRNDYWSQVPPAFTVRNIRRLVNYLRTTLSLYDAAAPFIAVNTLLPSTRVFQQPFINEVNELLLKQGTRGLQIAARFDLIRPELISDDGLHPKSAGYDAMVQLLEEYLVGTLQNQCLRRRQDNDRDQVFDRFEVSKFGTDPTLADSDGDGISDGEELFVLGTNPLVINAPTTEPSL